MTASPPFYPEFDDGGGGMDFDEFAQPHPGSVLPDKGKSISSITTPTIDIILLHE